LLGFVSFFFSFKKFENMTKISTLTTYLGNVDSSLTTPLEPWSTIVVPGFPFSWGAKGPEFICALPALALGFVAQQVIMFYINIIIFNNYLI
jgi:hypothetical protein